MLPPQASSASSTRARSTSRIASSSAAPGCGPDGAGLAAPGFGEEPVSPSASGVTVGVSVNIAARSIVLASCRTFPGQANDRTAARASGVRILRGSP
jgi:hypothetical protein